MNTEFSASPPAKKANVRYLVRLAFLCALLIVMSFTPLGYLRIGIVEISFLCLPVILAAVLLDTRASTLLGLAFGISSFITAFSSQFGMILLEMNSFAVFLTCIVPRVLMGLFAGLIFKFFNSIKKTKPLSHIIVSLSASLLNSVLFTVFLWFLFSDNPTFSIKFPFGATIGGLITAMVGFNGLIELFVSIIFGFIVGRIVASFGRRTDKKSNLDDTATEDIDLVENADVPQAGEIRDIQNFGDSPAE